MEAPGPTEPKRRRERLVVHGLVQGVGFRPFVHRLAEKHRLGGFVRNETAGVVIEAEGNPGALAAFVEELRLLAPPLAVVAAIERREVPPQADSAFRIAASAAPSTAAAVLIPPDVATCEACLREMRDPNDRRYRYPFLNCTDCGPRYTIVSELPYDRAATAMRAFVLCRLCREEYEDPRSRRYHAQPNACPACGPRLWLTGPDGRAIEVSDPIEEAAGRLAEGAIVAIKGIGGFHLACDATDEEAVRRLRERKGRPEKPFAVMARDRETVERVARLAPREREILTDWRRPILLCEPRTPSPIAPGVAGASRLLGLFLPYSPLHHLLLEGPRDLLVMTSGNRSDEPIARGNEEALERLGQIADLFLLHDREILQTADDSIARIVVGQPVLLRRSRGYVPQPVILPEAGPPVLAFGADLKGTCCLTRGDLAFSSPYLGDLADPDAAAQLERSALHLMRLLGVRPQRVVHDLHPDYVSTRRAEAFAARLQAPTLPIQHHHAHALSVLAEHGVRAPALAVCLDGMGHGSDGHVWGGEFLLVDGLRVDRLAHFRYLAMPGGDRAAVEPWRMALSSLVLAVGAASPRALEPWRHLPCFAAAPDPIVTGTLAMLEAPEPGPLTSSAGRLFDAVASILGLRQRMTYEGQAASELEDAAAESDAKEAYPLAWIEPAVQAANEDSDQNGPTGSGPAPPDRTAAAVIDPAPLFRALLDDARAGTARSHCARRFHNAMALAVREAAARARAGHGLDLVVLSGGVMQNRLFLESCLRALAGDGFTVLTHARVSPNDEGVALGQAWGGVLSFLD